MLFFLTIREKDKKEPPVSKIGKPLQRKGEKKVTKRQFNRTMNAVPRTATERKAHGKNANA